MIIIQFVTMHFYMNSNTTLSAIYDMDFHFPTFAMDSAKDLLLQDFPFLNYWSISV